MKRFLERGHPGVVFAVDASLPMLRTAKRLAVEEGVAGRIVFVHAHSEQLPFSAGAVLAELRRVLNQERGSFSLMFQVRGPHGLRTLMQNGFSRFLGLNVLSAKEIIRFVGRYFSSEVAFFGGFILVLRSTIPLAEDTAVVRIGKG